MGTNPSELPLQSRWQVPLFNKQSAMDSSHTSEAVHKMFHAVDDKVRTLVKILNSNRNQEALFKFQHPYPCGNINRTIDYLSNAQYETVVIFE